MRNCSNLTRMFNSAVTCRLVVQRVGVLLLLLLLLLCQVFNYWRTVHINGGAASFKNTVRAQKRAAGIRMRHQPRTGLCSRTGAQHGAWSRRGWLSWAELSFSLHLQSVILMTCRVQAVKNTNKHIFLFTFAVLIYGISVGFDSQGSQCQPTKYCSSVGQ